MTMPLDKNNSGSALITSVLLLALLIVITSNILIIAVNEFRMATRHLLTTEALYLGEAGIEKACYDLGNYVASNYEDPPDAPNAGSIQGNLALSSGFTVFYDCIAYGPERTFTDSDGITSYRKNFLISSSVVHDSGVSLGVNQIISRNKTYTFQHAVFYADDLEIFPGKPMTFSGRIHSNNTIFIGSDNSTLVIDSDYLCSAGDIYNRRKNDGSIPSGTVDVSVSGTSSYASFWESGDPAPLDSLQPNWTSEALNRWKGTVRSSSHGVTAKAVPLVGSTAPGGYYAANSTLYIENGNVYRGGPPSEGGVQLIDGIDMPAGTVSTSETFYNNREDSYVKMTDIDMRKLAGYAPGDPDDSPSYANNLPSNGLLYATRDDAGPFRQPGVRLKNGEKIERSDGLTVVSDAPVYIQGDYNKNDPSSGYDKKPCAVICDAVNLLSGAWSDDDSPGSLYDRNAVSSEYNTAFISGIDTTTWGDYNGGLENYPRLHENWSGRTLSIRGSFVELWNSQIALGEWSYGSPQYTAPNRNWDYDTDFNDSSKLPPFTPYAVETERNIWWVSAN